MVKERYLGKYFILKLMHYDKIYVLASAFFKLLSAGLIVSERFKGVLN